MFLTSVAEVTFAKAHVDLLVTSLDLRTPLLVVTGSPLHALSLCSNTIIVITKVLVKPLHDLAAPSCTARNLCNCCVDTLSSVGSFRMFRRNKWISTISFLSSGSAGETSPEQSCWIS